MDDHDIRMTSSEDFTSQPGSRRPSGNPWKQQQLAAFQPILTPRLVIITYLVIGIIFLPLGIAFLTTSDKVVEVASSDYASFNATKLKVTFTNLNIQPPIYMYYQVTEFYQNHRRYVKSRCDEQLRGVYASPSKCDCDPYAYYNNSGNEQDFLYPCGLQIKNVFNDTFNLVAENSTQTPIPMSTVGITWSTDLDYKFNNPAVNATPQGVRTVQDLKDPDFINWMRVAAFSTFRKLYRVINEPLVGNFTVYVTNNYNVSVFGGKKYVVLATSSWIGGKNQFLGVSYIVVGVVCIVLAFLFLLKQLIKPRLPGDVQYLEWSN